MPSLWCWCPSKRRRADKYHLDSREAVSGCPFCGIAEGAEQSRVLFQNERLVVFPDIRPRGRMHLLVTPRAHVANTNCLRPGDLELAEEMDRVGRDVLRQHAPPGSALKLGYHVPPWRSVDHLHLHCFALPHTPALAAAKYCLPGVWLSSEDLMARLREERGRGLLNAPGGPGEGAV